MKDCFLTVCVARRNPFPSQASPPILPSPTPLAFSKPGTQKERTGRPVSAERTWTVPPSAATYSVPEGDTHTAERSWNLQGIVYKNIGKYVTHSTEKTLKT